MSLPAKYAWLNTVGILPKMVQAALPLIGTVETPGGGNTPAIMAWAQRAGVSKIYTGDAVPWCGLFMAEVCRLAGKPVVTDPLWALNWAKFGSEAGQPVLGDVLTFTRPTGGHVALYIGEDAGTFHVLGGNQSDAVTITRIEKKRLYRARRPPFQTAMPASARPYLIDANGAVSRDEA